MRRLYRYQYAFIMLLSCVCSLFMITVVQNELGSGAWTAFFLCLVPGMAVGAVFAGIFARNEGLTLHEIHMEAYGRKAGKLMTWIYILFFLLTGSVLLDYYGLYTLNTVLKMMRLPVFIGAVALAAAYTAGKGSEILGRLGVILGALLLTMAVISVALQFIQGDVDKLFPIFGTSADKLLLAVASLVAVEFGEMTAVITFLPDVVQKKKLIRLNLWTMLAGNGLVALFAIGGVLVTGQTGGDVGFIRSVRSPGFGTVISSMEILAVGAFFFGAVFRLAVNICAICRCMKDTLGLRSEKNLALPVAGLMVGLSQLLTVSEEVIGRYLMHIYPYIALFPALVLPLITLGLSRKRRRVWR